LTQSLLVTKRECAVTTCPSISIFSYTDVMGEVFSKQRGQKIRNKGKRGKIKWNRELEYGENMKANKLQAYLGPLWQTKKLVLDSLFY